VKRDAWIWIGAAAAAALLLGRRREGGGSILLSSPVENTATPTVTPHGGFGVHRDGPPIHTHQGIDLAARPGSRVLAVGDGVIVATDPGLGKTVRKLRLNAPAAWSFGRRRVDFVVYADLGTPLKHPGERVRKGEPIALVDASGFVHFAVKQQQAGHEVFFDPKDAGFTYRPSSPAIA
jgi:murein DD-endopeptidase MepM/ murein hydrolase activator NlpD